MSEFEGTLVDATTGSNPDIIIKMRFQKMFASGKRTFLDYLKNHNGQFEEVTDVNNDYDVLTDETIKNEINGHQLEGKPRYRSYLEYAGRESATEKTGDNLSPIFTQDVFNLTPEQIDEMQAKIHKGEQRENTMWKMVVSLSDDFLIEQKIMDNAEERHLDQRRLKAAIQEAMPGLLESEGLEGTAEWFGAVHLKGDLNDKHIHVHISIFEPGVSSRETVYWMGEQQIKGKFKQESIGQAKMNLWRTLQTDEFQRRTVELKVNRSKYRSELINRVSSIENNLKKSSLLKLLIRTLPDNENIWAAGSRRPEMNFANNIAQEYVELLLEGEGKEEYEAYVATIEEERDSLRKALGESKKVEQNFVQNRLGMGPDGLRRRMVNEVYAQLKSLTSDDFRKSQTEDIMTTDPEENERMKLILEKETAHLRSMGQPVPATIKRELGLRKYAIRQRNLRADLEMVRQDIARLKLIPDTPYVLNMRDKLINKDIWLSNRLASKRDRQTPEMIAEQKALDNYFADIHQLSPNKFTQDIRDMLIASRRKELQLMKGATQAEYEFVFGKDVDSIEIINNLTAEINIIEIKGRIYDNNQLRDVYPGRTKEIGRENARLFGQIAELEGRENSFIDHQAAQRQQIQCNSASRDRSRKMNGLLFKPATLERIGRTARQNAMWDGQKRSKQRILDAYEENQKAIQDELDG